MITHGSWSIHTVDGADVRLRSGKIGLFTVDVTAPVRHGSLHIDASGVRLDLVLALERLSTGNFLVDRAAKSLVTRHNAHDLTYRANGHAGEQPWNVAGHAVSGDVDVELRVTVSPVGVLNPMDEIEIVGSGDMGTVHLPMPGLGTVDDFSFDVDARLSLLPSG